MFAENMLCESVNAAQYTILFYSNSLKVVENSRR